MIKQNSPGIGTASNPGSKPPPVVEEKKNNFADFWGPAPVKQPVPPAPKQPEPEKK